MKPREDFALIRFAGYGEWAAWEGLFYVWDLTRDEELRQFILSQLEWRLTEEKMNTGGISRDTDFNVAAYAYYLTGTANGWRGSPVRSPPCFARCNGQSATSRPCTSCTWPSSTGSSGTRTSCSREAAGARGLP